MVGRRPARWRTTSSRLYNVSNLFFSSGAKSGNEQFAPGIVTWTFQRSLVLRIDSTTHHLLNETGSTTPRTLCYQREYRTSPSAGEPGLQFADSTIGLRGAYLAVRRYYDHKNGWSPYSGLDDLQVEFTMLDPHIRTALLPVPGTPGLYRASFRVPDRHGVLEFVLDYRRHDWAGSPGRRSITRYPSSCSIQQGITCNGARIPYGGPKDL